MKVEEETVFVSLNSVYIGKSSEELSKELSVEITSSGINGNKNKRLQALGIICAGLMEASAKGPETYAIQRLAACDFTGKAIGYRPFMGTLTSLIRLGYIDFQEGYCPPLKKDWELAKASRFRATAKLLQVAERHGITPANWEHHYSNRPWNGVVDRPVILRSESLWIGSGWKKTKQPGSDMRFDPADPKVAPIIQQVNDLNAFFAEQDIQPAKLFRGFQRIFSKGDGPSFEWNKAGRLYAVEGGYQQKNSSHRALMTINGEPVAEVDIKASHLTILYALDGQIVDSDPYHVPGVDRDIVKMLVTVTLGRGKLPHRWPAAIKQQYMEDNLGRRLQVDHPIGATKKKVVQHIPLLAGLERDPRNWADLQYVESQVIIDAVYDLAFNHGIPTLPVHDSLIIPASKMDLAKTVLLNHFEQMTGVRPTVEVK